MEFRYLGNSGLKVSAISYGNWVTHGSQVEAEQATTCVRAALDAGITTFDTADVYANGKAESILGDALAGERRESLEIFTKVYFPTGTKGPNDTGLSRKHIHESINASLTPAADRLRRPLPGPPVRPRDAAGGDDGGLRRRRPGRQGPLHRRQRVDSRPAPGRSRPRPRAADSVRLQPAAVQRVLPDHRGRGRPDLPRARDQPGRLLPHRPGRAHRQVPARPAAARRFAGDRQGRLGLHQEPAHRRHA